MSEQNVAPEPAPATESPDSSFGFVESIDSIFSNLENPSGGSLAQETVEIPELDPESLTPKPQPDPDDPFLGVEYVEDSFKDWTPEAARRFKELKSELKNYKTRAQELEEIANQRASRLQELEALSDNPEYTELQDKIKVYEEQLMLTRLEKSSVYQQQIEAPMTALVTEADAIAEKYSIDSDSLIEAIAESDEQEQEVRLAELLVNASDRDKFRIFKIIEEISPILEKRQLIMENVQEALQEAELLEQEREKLKMADWANQRQNASRLVAERIKEKLPFLSRIEGLDLSKIASDASVIDPRTVDAVTGSYHAIAAHVLPKVAAHALSLQKELEVLTDKLAEYDKATPRVGGSKGYVSSSSSPSDSRSFLDAVSAAFGG